MNAAARLAVAEAFPAIAPATLAYVVAVLLVAGFVHGALGFGFPIIGTPLVALATDIKTSIVLVAPVTLVMVLLSVARGGGALEVIRRFWYLPAAMAVGAYAGTRVLIVARPEPFLLVLAAMLFVWLQLDRMKRGGSERVQRSPVAFGLGFGLAAGLTESLVNIALPPLLIFLMLMGLSPAATVQTLNLCFSVGKGVQVGTWAVFGNLPARVWLTAAALCVPCAFALWHGMRLRERIEPGTYRRWVRAALWIVMTLLCAQFAWLELRG